MIEKFSGDFFGYQDALFANKINELVNEVNWISEEIFKLTGNRPPSERE